MRERNELRWAVEAAWRSFGAAASLEARVSPAIPILFFGDLDAYAESQQRVLTVGLNPSLIEFPTGDPFRRFPLAEDAHPEDQERYLDALSAYFRTKPYHKWFRSFEPLLNGMSASYYDIRLQPRCTLTSAPRWPLIRPGGDSANRSRVAFWPMEDRYGTNC